MRMQQGFFPYSRLAQIVGELGEGLPRLALVAMELAEKRNKTLEVSVPAELILG